MQLRLEAVLDATCFAGKEETRQETSPPSKQGKSRRSRTPKPTVKSQLASKPAKPVKPKPTKGKAKAKVKSQGMLVTIIACVGFKYSKWFIL